MSNKTGNSINRNEVKIPYLEAPMTGLTWEHADDKAWDYYNTPGYADQIKQVPSLATGGIYDNKNMASSGGSNWMSSIGSGLSSIGSGLGSVVGLFGGDSKSGSFGGNPYLNLAQLGLGYLSYKDQKKSNDVWRTGENQRIAQNETLAKNKAADRKSLFAAWA